jgi:hypothetical protein
MGDEIPVHFLCCFCGHSREGEDAITIAAIWRARMGSKSSIGPPTGPAWSNEWPGKRTRLGVRSSRRERRASHERKPESEQQAE